MARTPTMKAIIDIIANTDEAKKKLTDLEKLGARLEKDGTTYKITADGSEAIKVAKKTLSEIKGDSKNKISLFELDESMNKQFEKIRKECGSLSEAMRKMFQDAFNGIGNGVNGSGNNVLSQKNGRIDELNNKIKEQNNLYKEQNFIVTSLEKKLKELKSSSENDIGKVLGKELISAYKKYDNAYLDGASDKKMKPLIDNFSKSFKNYVAGANDDRYFSKLSNNKDLVENIAEAFAMNNRSKNGSRIDLYGNDYEFKYFKDEWLKEGFGDTNKNSKENDNTKEILAVKTKLEEAKKLRNEYKKNIDKLESEVYSLKKEIENIQKENQEKAQESVKKTEDKNLKNANHSQGGKTIKETTTSKDGGGNTKSEKTFDPNEPISVKIEPANLEEFYQKIEGHGIAKIKVDIDEENLKNKLEELKNKKQKETPQYQQKITQKQTNNESIWDGVDDKSKELIKYIDSQRKVYKKEKSIDIYGNIVNLLKSSIDSKKPLDNKQVADLVALTKSYKNATGNNSPVADILKEYGKISNFDDVIPGYGELKKKYEDVLKKANSLKKEKSKKTSLEDNDNETNIENKPEEFSIDVKLNVDQSEIESLKNKIETGLGEVNVRLSNGESVSNGEDKNSLNSVYEKYNEILLLQKQIKSGNADLAPTYSSNGKKLTTKGILEEDIRGKSVKKSSINALVKEYNDLYKKAVTQQAIDESYKNQGKEVHQNTYKKQLAELQEKITLYAGSYKDIQSLMSIPMEKDGFWSEVIIDIQNATEAQQAYLQIGEKVKALFSEMSSITGKQYTKEEQDNFAKSLFNDKDRGKSIIDEQFKQEDESQKNDKIVEVNLKANIASLNKSIQEQKSSIQPVDVDVKIDNIKGLTDGEGLKIDNVKTSVSELIAKIKEIGTAFDTANNSVLESSVKQISSIDSIAASVVNLKDKLQEVGATSIVEITKVVPDDIEKTMQSIQEEREKLEKEQQLFKKQQEKFNKEQENKKTKNDTSVVGKEILETRSKLIDAAKNTKNFNIDEESIKISNDGIVEFTATIEDLSGKLVQAKYKYEDFSKAITKGGKLSSKELSNSMIGVNSLSVKDQLLYAAEKTKGLNIDSKSIKVDESGVISFTATLEKAGEEAKTVKYEIEDLNAMLTKTGAISQSFLKNNTVGIIDEKSLNKLKTKYDKLGIGSIDENNLLNTNINIDGQIRSVTELKNETIEYLNALEEGGYKSKEAFDKAATSVQKNIESLNKLNAKDNQKNYKKGESIWSYIGSFDAKNDLKDIDRKDIEEQIKKVLLKSNQQVRFTGKYNKTKNQIGVELINDDRLIKTTASLQQYTDASGKANVAIRTLAGTEEKYVSVGQKWVNGFKAKLSNLTQYITGIELVQRALMELKEGFNFKLELDSQLTTINQTMSVTRDELNQLGSSSIDAAKNLGSTANDVLDAVAIYANANETAESILKKAQPTVMLANASGQDTSTAADQIQAVVNQWKELEGQERRIVNSYEKISSGLAIDFAKVLARRLEIIY